MSDAQLLGVDEFLSEVRRRLGNAASRVERVALKEGGKVLADGMKSKINRSLKNHLHLKDDIKVSGIRERDGVKYVLIGPGRKTAWRAKFLEYGTAKMKARPFAYPGFHENKNEAYEAMKREFKKGLEG